MKKSIYGLLAVLIFAALLLSACGGGSSASNTPSGGAKPAVPADYAGKTNPLSGDQAVAAGKDLFNTNCASCHGESGKGDGPAGQALNPKPANLTADASAGVKDDYYFWRINEGGAMAPFNSSMPAFKGVLSEEQIWQIITYIKTLK